MYINNYLTFLANLIAARILIVLLDITIIFDCLNTIIVTIY
jgi:hypothetical protein